MPANHDLSSPIGGSEGREAERLRLLRELWRQHVYPHVSQETFDYMLADLTAEGWDDVRVEMKALQAVAAALTGGPSPQATEGLLRERLEGMVSWWDGKLADAVTGQDAEDLLSALRELLSDPVTS